MAKIDLAQTQEEFENWYADKFITVRHRENRPEMSAQKWVSQKEIELMVRREYKEEYMTHKNILIGAEHKVAFLRRLLESWQGQAYILSTLSKNVQSEVNGLLLNNSGDSNEQPRKTY